MHKQETCVANKLTYSLCRHMCLHSDVISKNNAQHIKTITSLQWKTVQYRILCKPGSCSLWRRHFFDAHWTQDCLAWRDFDKTANQRKST